MSAELILSIGALILSAIVAATSARKNRVDTIVKILDELTEQYNALKKLYDTLKDKYDVLKLEYEKLLKENIELRLILSDAGIDCLRPENGRGGMEHL